MDDVCRICRAEGTEEEPLYHPCKCSGSIRYVHEECLMEWLSHARQGTRCELCRTKFTFQKHYKSTMPLRLPLWTFIIYFGDKMLLLARSTLLLALLAVLVKYTFELSTVCAAMPLKFLSVNAAVRVLKSRMARPSVPFMDWLALPYLEDRPRARELYAAVLDGGILLAVLIAILAVVFVFAVWVFTDESLIHDLDHIALGELGHIDHGDYEDEPFAPENHGNEAQDDRQARPEPQMVPEVAREQAAPRQPSAAEVELAELLAIPAAEDAPALPVVPPLPEIPQGPLPRGVPFRTAFMQEWTIAARDGNMAITQNVANRVADFFETYRTIWGLVPGGFEVPRTWKELGLRAEQRAEPADPSRQNVLDLAVFEQARQIMIIPARTGAAKHLERVRDLVAVVAATANIDNNGNINVDANAHVEPNANVNANVVNEEVNIQAANIDANVDMDDFELQAFPRHAWVGALERNINDPDVEGDLWGTAVGVIFGPTSVVLQNFFIVAVLLSALIQAFYTLPYVSGYWLCKIFIETLRTVLANVGQLRLATALPRDIQPTSLAGHIGIVLLAFNVFMCSIRGLELFYMRRLLKSAAGRYFVSHFLQLYVFYKAVAVVFTELLVFPIYCGTLLHLALLPALPSGSLQFAFQHPALVLLLQAMVGFAYMYLLNYFVGASRSFFRPGTLYFAQDPNDPAFDPTHAIVTHPLPLQLRRIALSGLIYTFLIAGGVGGAIYLLAHLLPFLFPLRISHWPGWNLFRLWPLAGSVYWTYKKRLFTRAAVRHWWTNDVWRRPMKAAARNLDLDSWLFGVKKDPNGPGNKEGRFVRAPGIDNIKPRRSLQLFVPVTAANEREDGKAGVLENEVATYVVVWRPRGFWLRLAGLMIVAWVAGINLVLQFTLTPLLIGQVLDRFILGNVIRNDLVLYLTGLCLWVPIWAKRTLASPPSDEERAAGRHWYPSSFDVVDIARSFIFAAFVTAMYPVLMRGYSSPTQYKVINWLLLANDAFNLPFPGYQLAKVLTVSLIQSFMPNKQYEAPPKSFSSAIYLGLTFLQPVIALHRLYQVLNIAQRLRALSVHVRDRFYLEGERLHNYGDRVTSFE